MPPQMASHWNSQGEVNGYMSKFWGLFFLPLISIALFAIFYFIPLMDPKRKNIEQFRVYFDWFIVLFIFFLTYIHVLSLYWNLGHQFNMTLQIIPGIALLFYYIGIMLRHTKQNWFIGIRTPWTLNSETIWNKTHAIGGKLFKASAIICLLGLIFQKYAIFFMLIPVLISAIITILYSFILYKKQGKK
ncbi:SdpI family protein [Candidatus Woesearchaeota archaeon]|nr:MAG: SdpI family protein [Candidatus Woesearchaeota archaeon]